MKYLRVKMKEIPSRTDVQYPRDIEKVYEYVMKDITITELILKNAGLDLKCLIQYKAEKMLKVEREQSLQDFYNVKQITSTELDVNEN